MEDHGSSVAKPDRAAKPQPRAERHTPGPWRLFLTQDGRKLIGIGDQSGGGITDAGFGTWRSGKEQIANACLIAAAPDLFEALERINAATPESTNSATIAQFQSWVRAVAGTAIAKATKERS